MPAQKQNSKEDSFRESMSKHQSDVSVKGPPDFDSRPGKLFQARQLWSFLLRSGTPCESRRWRDWADGCIRASSDAIPQWIFALSVAATNEEAVSAVEQNIGTDFAAFEGQILERDAMTIGLVYARYLDGALSHQELWAQLRRVVDIAAFLDDGQWQRWHRAHPGDPEDPLAPNAGWIRHLAWLAVRAENELLRDPGDARTEPGRTPPAS